MELSGNTILITGGTSGIGRALALKFNDLGNKVIICGRRKGRLQEISAQFPNIVTKVCDVNDADEREELAYFVKSGYPGLNVLINNAGVQYPFDLQGEIDFKKLYSEIEINFTAPVHLTSLLINQLKINSSPVVINISSGLGFVPIASLPIYCATKSAMHSYSLSLRHQLKSSPVRVFEIIPPSVDTELGSERRKDKKATHGGISAQAFVEKMLEALKKDIYEAPVGEAKNLWTNREGWFDRLNSW